MATNERLSRRFDSFGFRPRDSVRTRLNLDGDASDTVGDRQRIFAQLSALGYSKDQVGLILEGPLSTSIEALMGKVIPARSVPMKQLEAPPEGSAPSDDKGQDPIAPIMQPLSGAVGPESSKPVQEPAPPAAEPPSAAVPPPAGEPLTPKKYPAKVAADEYIYDLDQADIIDAIWLNLHGDPAKLVLIAQNFESLSGPLQAYVSAAASAGRSFLIDLNKWIADFDRAQAKAQKERSEEENKKRGVVHAVAGAAAAAANSIPVVGQVISLAIAAGVAISEALLAAFPLPLRQGADQVIDAYEGLDAFWGISYDVEPNEEPALRQDRFLAAKQAVVQDPVATELPIPRDRSRYKFTPTISQYRRAAHELGLYPGEPNAIEPTGQVS